MAGTKKSKATKKFEKNRLKETIDRRKDSAKVKQRQNLKEKKQRKRIQDEEKSAINGSSKEDAKGQKNALEAEEMNNDAYFQNTLQIPNRRKKESKTTDVQRNVPSQNGKRKRTSESEPQIQGDSSEEDEQAESLEADSVDQEDGEHKDQLDALADKDPEFYKYLKENDADLLDFEETGDLSEVEALSGEEDDDERPAKKRKNEKTIDMKDKESKVSIEMIEKWKVSMVEQHSIRALRQVVLAFRAAVHINDEDIQDSKYTIADSEVYHQVLVTALNNVGPVLDHHLPVKESAAGKLRVPTDSKKFKILAPLIKSHASSVHYVLKNLADTSTLRLTLQSFEPILPYLLQFRKFLKTITKTIADIWSDKATTETVRITAFIILRRLVVTGDPGIRETVLKSCYEGIVKGSRNTTMHTLPGINLMKNSAAEIWAIDSNVGYAVGFTHIRQLAIHLRSNITKPTKDSYKTIYNWQYIHSLDFWSRVLSTHCNPLAEASASGKTKSSHTTSPLRPLIYPLVQLSLGTLHLIPTSAYFPLRFHIIRSLLRLASSTSTFIPLAPSLLEVLNSSEMKKPPKPSTLKPLDLTTTLRAPASYLKTRVYQDVIGAEVVELLSEFFVGWTKSIAFPELQLPVTVALKRWLRSVSSSAPASAKKSNGNGAKNVKINQQIALLVQKLESNARWIEERRNQVSFSPRDRTEVKAFLKDVEWEVTPLGAFVQGQRKGREERRRVLEKDRDREGSDGRNGGGGGLFEEDEDEGDAEMEGELEDGDALEMDEMEDEYEDEEV
ncbi:MAG: hypothetical protein Q9160_003912 [Pyrenula sp. 1 TL-2023]